MTLPDTFFVFAKKYDPMTVHNLRFTKQLSAGCVGGWGDSEFLKQYVTNEIDWLPLVSNPKTSQWISKYSASILSEYGVEANAELFRRENFPELPSRFSAVFAFGSMEDCGAVSQKHGWDLTEVREFVLKPNPLNRVARVNMEIVSLARSSAKLSSPTAESSAAIWNAYWSGKTGLDADLPWETLGERETFSPGTTWEYLIDGVLELTDVQK